MNSNNNVNEPIKESWEYFKRANYLAKVSTDKITEEHRMLINDCLAKIPSDSESDIYFSDELWNDIETHQVNTSHAWFFEDEHVKKQADNGFHERRILRAFLTGDLTGLLLNKEFNIDSENTELNNNQRIALRRALGSDVTIIKGPPGTGKTTVIAEILKCIVERNDTVAVVSSNTSAIENVKNKMEQSNLGKGAECKVALLGNKDVRKNFKHDEAASEEKKKLRFKEEEKGGREKELSAKEFLACYPIVLNTLHSLAKSFKDGTKYQYDYVIMDEASQTDPIAGLIAAYCAKKLVLVGDEHQLPPIIQGRDLKLLHDCAKCNPSSEHLRMSEEKSYFDVWLDIFEKSNAETNLLNEHYRCDPLIIGFCNEKVYKHQLEIKTNSSEAVPLRVVWSEGDYSERYVTNKAKTTAEKRKEEPKITRANMRQINVFMEEEWPSLQQRLAENDDLTACVLAPYRGQLELIRFALAEKEYSDRVQVPELVGQKIFDSTVHKAQGREYDIVYFMPVDEGKWDPPWNQKKRLINVAVSRAKKEFCIITSTRIMSSKLRKYLPDANAYISPKDNERKVKGDDYFLESLLDYIHRAIKQDESYVKSAFCSILDDDAKIFIDKHQREKLGIKNRLSNAEQSFVQGLAKSDILNDYIVIHEMFVRDIFKNHTESKQRFDFVILSKDMVPLMAIEIDGPDHRVNPEENIIANDSKKDEICGGSLKYEEIKRYKNENINNRKKKEEEDNIYFEYINPLSVENVDEYFDKRPGFTLLRIPTNGLTYGEINVLRDQIRDINPRIAESINTIEDILERQIKLHEEGVDAQSRLPELIDCDIDEVKSEGLVDYAFPENKGPIVATEMGRDHGIVNRITLDENGNIVWVPYRKSI